MKLNPTNTTEKRPTIQLNREELFDLKGSMLAKPSNNLLDKLYTSLNLPPNSPASCCSDESLPTTTTTSTTGLSCCSTSSSTNEQINEVQSAGCCGGPNCCSGGGPCTCAGSDCRCSDNSTQKVSKPASKKIRTNETSSSGSIQSGKCNCGTNSDDENIDASYKLIHLKSSAIAPKEVSIENTTERKRKKTSNKKIRCQCCGNCESSRCNCRKNSQNCSDSCKYCVGICKNRS